MTKIRPLKDDLLHLLMQTELFTNDEDENTADEQRTEAQEERKMKKNAGVSALKKFNFVYKKSGEQTIPTVIPRSKDSFSTTGNNVRRNQAKSVDQVLPDYDPSFDIEISGSRPATMINNLVFTKNGQEILENLSQNDITVMNWHESTSINDQGQRRGDNATKNSLDSSKRSVKGSSMTFLTEEKFHHRINQLEQRMITALAIELGSMFEILHERLLESILKLNSSWKFQGELVAVRKEFRRKETAWKEKFALIQEELEGESRAKRQLLTKLVAMKNFHKGNFIPRRPNPRPPLARMLNSSKCPGTTSPRLPRAKSKSPLSSDEDPYSSDSNSDDSVDDAHCSTPHNYSPMDRRRMETTSSPRARRNISGDSKASEIPRAPSPQSSAEKSFQSLVDSSISIICLIILAGIAFLFIYLSDAQNVTVNQPIKTATDRNKIIEQALQRLENNIDGIMMTFGAQDPLIWKDIEGGIAEVVINPKRPTIVILFANEEDPMSCLAKMIGNVSKDALGSEESLVLSKENLGDDYGMVIHRFKEIIKEQKVVIIENLLDIHPEAIKAFHNMCDRENPLVGEAIYILTIVTNGYKNQSSMQFIEDQLTSKLKGKVDDEKLQPLITRITDGVIVHVQPEPDITRCPIRY